MRSYTISFAALLVAIFVVICGAREVFAENAKLKIGAVLPLSGAGALYGDPCKNGIEMALSEIRAQHKGDDRLEVIFEDDAFQPAKTVSAFKKLVEQDKTQVMISIASTHTNAVAPVAEAKKIPLFGWASDTKATEKRHMVVRTYASGYMEGKVLADRAREIGKKTAALVTSINDYPDAVKTGFIRTFGEENIILSEEFPPDSKDFKSFLGKLAKANPDIVFLCLSPGGNSLFAKQMTDFLLRPQIAGCEAIGTMDEVRASGGGLLNAYFASVQPLVDFRKRYVERYQNDNIISGAAVHYELIWALDSMMRQLQALNKEIPTGEALIRYLMEQDLGGRALGNFKLVSRNGDQFFDVPLDATIIREDRFEPVAKR